MTFDQDRMASGSLDRTIRVWDIKSGALLQTLKGHTKGVWCLRFFTKNLLISGGHDGAIKVCAMKQDITESLRYSQGWAMKGYCKTLEIALREGFSVDNIAFIQ